MTRFRAVLNRSRPYGIVYGNASHRYEQDGQWFDSQGLEVDEKGRLIIQQGQRSTELTQATLRSGTVRSAASRSMERVECALDPDPEGAAVRGRPRRSTPCLS